MKLILENRSKLSDEDAINAMMMVIQRGKISEAGGIKHYCWTTTYCKGSIMIYTRRKRNKNSADSLVCVDGD